MQACCLVLKPKGHHPFSQVLDAVHLGRHPTSLVVAGPRFSYAAAQPPADLHRLVAHTGPRRERLPSLRMLARWNGGLNASVRYRRMAPFGTLAQAEAKQTVDALAKLVDGIGRCLRGAAFSGGRCLPARVLSCQMESDPRALRSAQWVGLLRVGARLVSLMGRGCWFAGGVCSAAPARPSSACSGRVAGVALPVAAHALAAQAIGAHQALGARAGEEVALVVIAAAGVATDDENGLGRCRACGGRGCWRRSAGLRILAILVILLRSAGGGCLALGLAGFLGPIAGSSLGGQAAKRCGQDQGTHGWAALRRGGGVVLKGMGRGLSWTHGAVMLSVLCPTRARQADG